jgi:hypothetical protein
MKEEHEAAAQPATSQGDAGEAPLERGHAVPEQEEVPAVGQDVEGAGPLTLCGGCGLSIHEVEESVWVRGGSDECEGGGVHSPQRDAVEADGKTIWLIRHPDNDKLYLDHDQNWSALPMAAVYVDWEKAIIEVGEHAKDYVWVAFCEAPF